jgi:hypothetical protein
MNELKTTIKISLSLQDMDCYISIQDLYYPINNKITHIP